MNQMSAIRPVPVIDSRAYFTAKEFERIAAAAAEQGIRLELMRGELQRMTPPMGYHFVRQSRLFEALLTAVRGTERQAVVEAGLDLGEDTITTCDAAVLFSPLAENRFARPADVALIVEVAQTTLDRDLGPKRRLYAAAGIAHYWVIDGLRSVVHVFGEPKNGDYTSVAITPFGEPLSVPGTGAAITLD